MTATGVSNLSIGIRLPNSGPFATAENVMRIAGEADAIGFGDVWVHDHVSWSPEMLTHFAAGSVEACRDQPPNFFESVTAISCLSGRLENVGLGIAGLILPLRDPRVLAKQLATTAALNPTKRVVAAVGSGAIKADFEVMGIPWNRRGALANDHLGALRAILEDPQPEPFASENVQFANGSFFPAVSNVELWAVGDSEAGLKRAARHGDGWLSAYLSPLDYRSRSETLSSILSEGDRDPGSVTRALETFISVADSDREAEDMARASLIDRHGNFELGMDVGLIGSMTTVAERMESYADAGVEYFEVKTICSDMKQMSDTLSRIKSIVSELQRRNG